MKIVKRILGALLGFAFLLAIGAGAIWWFFLRGPSTAGAYAALVPTGPIACPDDPNDLAGIEGWAPGAGKAEKLGQTGAGNIGSFGGALGGDAPAASPTAGKTCTGLRSDVAARFDVIADRIKQLPTSGFDPAERGKAFTTPDAAFGYVRDGIATEGYAGAMRGASGTLQSHSGSPADKALLLGALLAAQNVPVRFVHSQLADNDVAQAVAAAAATPPPPENPQLDDTFKALNIDPVAARAAAKAMRDQVEADAESTIGGAKTSTDDLLATLGTQHVTLTADDTSLRNRWTANFRDHWWLQAQVNNQWVDYDPTLRSATTGTHLGPAPTDDPASTIPDTVFTTLTVRLTADRLPPTGGAPTTATLVEKTVKAADAYAEPLVVSLGDRSVGSDKLAQAVSFTPSIAFKGDETTGDAFNTAGLLVVRMQIEASQGGTTRHVASRVVLDARNAAGNAVDATFGDGKRYAYGLTGVYSVLPVSGEIDPALLGLHEAAGMQSLRAFMAYAGAGGNGRQMPPPGVAESYPIKALRWFAYDALTRRLIEDDSKGAVRFAFDRPDVAIEHHGFDSSAPQLKAVEQFDIADNAMLPVGADHAASVRANVTRGYVDTVAEHQLFAQPGDGGTIALFDAAKKAGVAFTVLQGDQYGGTALAPQKAVALAGTDRMGWFAIDPQDGNLVGRMAPDGAGQELAEYAIARANDWSTLYAMIQFYGDFFRCIAGAVEAPLSGSKNPQGDFEQCAGAAICSYLEALTVGEAYSRWGTDEEALLYNILDISIPGTKDSWPPTGGAVCSGLFHSPLYP